MAEVFSILVAIYLVAYDIIKSPSLDLIIESIISVPKNGFPENKILIKENKIEAYDNMTLDDFISASKRDDIARWVK